MSLGRRLKRLRAEKKLGLRQLSDATGLSPSQLSRIERDLDSPKAENLFAIAQYYGVTMESLLAQRIQVPSDQQVLAEVGIAAIIENVEGVYGVVVSEVRLVRTVEGNNLAMVKLFFEED